MYHVWVYSVRLDLLPVAFSNQTLNVNNKSLRWVIMGNPQLLQHNDTLFISSVFYAYSYEFLMNVTRLSPRGWSLGMRLWINGVACIWAEEVGHS